MDQESKYPWQQAVLDAFLARPDSLVAKINVAEKAISARLTDENLTDLEERVALRDALRSLSVLIHEAEARAKTAPPKNEEEDIA